MDYYNPNKRRKRRRNHRNYRKYHERDNNKTLFIWILVIIVAILLIESRFQITESINPIKNNVQETINEEVIEKKSKFIETESIVPCKDVEISAELLGGSKNEFKKQQCRIQCSLDRNLFDSYSCVGDKLICYCY